MPYTDFDPQAMNEAATEAIAVFEKTYNEASPEVQRGMREVAFWFDANYMSAGHKRLGRFLAKFAKEHAGEA